MKIRHLVKCISKENVLADSGRKRLKPDPVSDSPSLHLTVLIPGQCPSDNPGRAMSGGQGHLVNVAQPFKIKMSFKRSVTVAKSKRST